jgi:hypothetical protein
MAFFVLFSLYFTTLNKKGVGYVGYVGYPPSLWGGKKEKKNDNIKKKNI